MIRLLRIISSGTGKCPACRNIRHVHVMFIAVILVMVLSAPAACGGPSVEDLEAVKYEPVVRDDWHQRGIGSFLYRYLTTIAKGYGIAGFTAEVLRENKGMQAILNGSEGTVRTEIVDDVISYQVDFA